MAGAAGIRAVARRHEHQDRGRQDRDRRRHGDDHRHGHARSTRSRRSTAASAAPCSSRAPSRCTGARRWIAGTLEPAGTAACRCRRGRRAAVRQEPAAGRRHSASAATSRAATRLPIIDPDGREIARGLVAYDAADAVQIAGRRAPRSRRCSAMPRARRWSTATIWCVAQHGAETATGTEDSDADDSARRSRRTSSALMAEIGRKRARRGAAAGDRHGRAQARRADRHGRCHPRREQDNPRRQRRST